MFTVSSIWDYLKTYTDLELFLKQFYDLHHQYYPLEYYPPFSNDDALLPLANEFFQNHKNLLHPEELSEEQFFQSHLHVQIVRHYRYLYSVSHTHAFFEMVYVLKGECSHEVDNQSLSLHTGDLCIIPPGVMHSVTVNTDSIVLDILLRASSFTKQFSALLSQIPVLSEFFNEIVYSDTYKKYLLFHTENDPVLSNHVLEMYAEQENQLPCYENILNGQLLVFLGKLLQRHQDSIEYPPNYAERFSSVPRILNYIRQNCCDVTLGSCADAFHFNPQYLSKLLKKETGKNFSTLLTEEKMEKAGSMLLESSVSVQQLGELLGFSDPSYFMKVFKKHFGCTPSAYRSNHTSSKKL